MTSALVVPDSGYSTLSRLVRRSRWPPTFTYCSADAFDGGVIGVTIPSPLPSVHGVYSVNIRGQNDGMRSIWKGSLSFGLVNVPVKLYSATEDHDVSLHQVHDADGGRIRYKRV